MSGNAAERFDAIVVGAGFAGLYALRRLRGMGLDTVAVEAGTGVGGTWFWNTYPGARCDVESFEYSYSFDPELEQSWQWSERYAAQPEILRYLEHVAERFDLKRDIRFETRVRSAQWDDERQVWRVDTTSGTLEARYLVMATGCLSRPNVPDIAGQETFSGKLFHSGRWPKETFDPHGLDVGVIGTGSSGVQIASSLAPQVRNLYVFQRTPHWIIPAGNRPIPADEDARMKAHYRAFREQLRNSLLGMGVEGGGGSALAATAEERNARYEECWQHGGPVFLLSYDDLLFDMDANATACEFLAGKIRQSVDDPATAEALIPDAARYPVGARRLIMDDNYYKRFNLPNVHLVDLRADPLDRITAAGVLQASGRETKLDAIVLATGFDALTGALFDIDIVGRDGARLRDRWADGPHTYLGLGAVGFPNLFTITGPGSPSVFSNVVVSIEQHVDFVADMIGWMRDRDLATAEPEPKAVDDWGEHVIEAAMPTVFMKVDSWYWGANVAGKPKAFLPYLGGVGTYREECSQIAGNGYTGYSFR